ncbi:MAG: hypothetical protein EBQ92_00565, partial [Proteobacteria bacterium]|nr:hypothetical protein [Pseudomonadota bacterium]
PLSDQPTVQSVQGQSDQPLSDQPTVQSVQGQNDQSLSDQSTAQSVQLHSIQGQNDQPAQEPTSHNICSIQGQSLASSGQPTVQSVQPRSLPNVLFQIDQRGSGIDGKSAPPISGTRFIRTLFPFDVRYDVISKKMDLNGDLSPIFRKLLKEDPTLAETIERIIDQTITFRKIRKNEGYGDLDDVCNHLAKLCSDCISQPFFFEVILSLIRFFYPGVTFSLDNGLYSHWCEVSKSANDEPWVLVSTDKMRQIVSEGYPDVNLRKFENIIELYDTSLGVKRRIATLFVVKEQRYVDALAISNSYIEFNGTTNIPRNEGTKMFGYAVATNPDTGRPEQNFGVCVTYGDKSTVINF